MILICIYLIVDDIEHSFNQSVGHLAVQALCLVLIGWAPLLCFDVDPL